MTKLDGLIRARVDNARSSPCCAAVNGRAMLPELRETCERTATALAAAITA